MKQYLLSVHLVDGAEPPAPPVMEQMYRDVDTFNQKVMAQGAWVFAGGLQPRFTATVVRMEGGRAVTTAGPHSDAPVYLGGFWVIRTDDLDAALAWAAEATAACQSPVEVRPFEDDVAQ